MNINIKFWGVRGSIACPSSMHVMYGGNTSCVELMLDDKMLILDAGTGLRSFGKDIVRRGELNRFTLLLTHSHWDHINGFPFFDPIYAEGSAMHIMAGHLYDKGGIKNILSNQMSNPVFPVPFDAIKANLTFQDFEAGDSFPLLEDVRVKTIELNHPNRSTGYRIEYKGKVVCYVTDTEHKQGELDENVLELIDNADVVIYDSTFTDDEFEAKIGWGHSTWQQGVRLCKKANAKQLVIFHHSPDHNDRFMKRIETEAARTWDGALVARDNMEIRL
ncbi:MAG: MBL fold metallo-hydrolase [Alphaproteobacteria bacterium]|nr:MBL fold metallo-hydrolase [Alphaproteobacteria bacterium]